MDNLGPVSLIGINRPERRNAVDPPTADILYRAFKDFEGDDSRRVAVLYGKGKQEDDYMNYLEREREIWKVKNITEIKKENNAFWDIC